MIDRWSKPREAVSRLRTTRARATYALLRLPSLPNRFALPIRLQIIVSYKAECRKYDSRRHAFTFISVHSHLIR